MLLGSLVSLGRWTPLQVVLVNSEPGLPILGTPHVLLNQFWGHTDDMLTFPVFDHVESL